MCAQHAVSSRWKEHSSDMESLRQLMQFMAPDEREDLKLVAVTHLLSVTGSEEGRALVISCEEIIPVLMKLTKDSNRLVRGKATRCLVNISGDMNDALTVFQLAKGPDVAFPIVQEALKHILDENSAHADEWTMALCNLTRNTSNLPEIIAVLEEDESTLLRLGNIYTALNYNKHGAEFNHLGSIFGNITQILRGREVVCLPKYKLLEKILPFTMYQRCKVRRAGAMGAIYNISKENGLHEALLGANDDVLSAVLMPLCGPEEFSDEEVDKFPMDLQYLPATKTREEDPDLRKLLLKTLLYFCTLRRFRVLLRAKGVYEILREYHKWETSTGGSSECVLACENVVDILIKTEEEIGVDNYDDVVVPAATAAKFKADDEAYLKNLKATEK